MPLGQGIATHPSWKKPAPAGLGDEIAGDIGAVSNRSRTALMKRGDGPPSSGGEFSGLSSSGHSFTRHGDETVRGSLSNPSPGTFAGAAARVVVVVTRVASSSSTSARIFARARPASAASVATLRPLRLCPSIICQFHHIMPSATAPQMTLLISGSPMLHSSVLCRCLCRCEQNVMYTMIRGVFDVLHCRCLFHAIARAKTTIRTYTAVDLKPRGSYYYIPCFLSGFPS